MEKVHIFDLDGTLVDSMPVWTAGTIRLLENAGLDADDMERVVRHVTPLGVKQAVKYLIEIGIPGSEEEMIREIESGMVYEYEHNIKMKKGAEALIRKLHAEGKRLFVLTASPHITTDPCLKNNNVFELFERVFTIYDFDLLKSDVRIYDETAKTIGVSADDIIFYDDNIIALETAKKAGLHTVAVYDASSESDTEKKKAIAEAFVDFDR